MCVAYWDIESTWEKGDRSDREQVDDQSQRATRSVLTILNSFGGGLTKCVDECVGNNFSLLTVTVRVAMDRRLQEFREVWRRVKNCPRASNVRWKSGEYGKFHNFPLAGGTLSLCKGRCLHVMMLVIWPRS